MRSRTLYTADIADRILSELRAGRSLHDICGDDGMPCCGTVLAWVRRDRDGFAAKQFGNRPDIAWREDSDSKGGNESDLAELMKLIDGRSGKRQKAT
jgi:hypothetical protein